MSEKIQKILAGLGYGSRREIEQWLRDGRISINGKVAVLGERITPDVQIRIDGKEIRLNAKRPAKTRVLLYHKPEGEICSRHDPEERPSVFDHLPLLRNGRWVSVGRLDFNTSGILLFTNDGNLANQLMHPSTHIEREYAVRVKGQVSKDMLTALKNGVTLEDGPAHFKALSDQGGEGSNHWYHVTVEQGRNRIVRRLFESQDIFVSRLIRIRFGTLTLPRLLRRGKWMELTLDQVTSLLTHQESTPLKPHATPHKKAARPFKGNTAAGSRGQAAGRGVRERDGRAPARRGRDAKDARPGSQPFTGKPSHPARPERDGKPAFKKPFRAKREDSAPSKRSDRSSHAHRPETRHTHHPETRHTHRPETRHTHRPAARPRDPENTQRELGSRGQAAGRREGGRPQNPENTQRGFGSRGQAAGRRGSGRPRDPENTQREFGSRGQAAGRREGGRPRDPGNTQRGSVKRFSNDVSPKNKITRWEKYPTETKARSGSPRPKPSRPGGNAMQSRPSTRPGTERRPVTKAPKKNYSVLKLREPRKGPAR